MDLLTKLGEASLGRADLLTKLAMTPAALALMGTGLGAGIGAVHGWRTDDPTKSYEHHLLHGARNALIGGAAGGLLGGGVGKLLKKINPAIGEGYNAGPFPWAFDSQHPDAPGRAASPAEAMAQAAYKLYSSHPVRLASGALVGYEGAKAYADMVDESRLQQHAAISAKSRFPEDPSAASLAAHVARKHMGPYSSSLDRRGG